MDTPKEITVNEQYQTGYKYTLSEPIGKNFDPAFKPQLTPKEMLDLGIFGGNYFTETPNEFPKTWFENVVFSNNGAKKELNLFKVNASQPLSVWQRKGWIYFEDPKGWFLWYCRYYMGRRIPEEDQRQIKRWLAIKRHISQLQNSCLAGDISCQPKRRQALLHWAYDSRKL
ncbi:hypothetical protein KC930_03095 [Candidatus Saccharibacteria bacterium]|nr:hypothetical protein [Candidatus Saccharibacteria bacterium]